MNIAIFGDSFANGVSDGKSGLYHSGLTQYLLDDDHFVINFSHQGNTNLQIRQDFEHNLRQNPHINFDIALVFQSETNRDKGEMLWGMEEQNISIEEVDIQSTIMKNGVVTISETRKWKFREVKHLEQGYEGQMVRKDAPYENKRSATLLKRKEFTDAEYKVLDIEEGDGNRTGTVKHLVCYCPTTDRTFNSNVKGNFEYLKEVLAAVRPIDNCPDGDFFAADRSGSVQTVLT
mgnify:CR=1 FL=1